MGYEIAADGSVIYSEDKVSSTKIQLDLHKEARAHLRLAAEKLLKLEYVSDAVTSSDRTQVNRMVDSLSSTIFRLERKLSNEELEE